MKRLYTVLTVAVLALLLIGGIPRSAAQETTHYFPETGHTVRGLFWQYWQGHGGLAQQGYPLSDELQEVSALNGKTYTVQYFERAAFEYHPENAGTSYEVLLSQLGVYRYQAKYTSGAANQHANQTAGSSHYFPETQHWVGGAFWQYWLNHGGLAQQGYPISNEFTESSDLNGKPYMVQYFERAVFEYHSENAGTPYEVLLSQLGKFQWDQKQGGRPLPIASPQPPPPSAGPGQGFGVEELHVFWGAAHINNLNTIVDRTKQAGLTQLRFIVDWQDAQPAPGVSGWSTNYIGRMDVAVQAMRDRGIEPLAVLATAPEWARRNTAAHAPNKLPDGNDLGTWAIPPDRAEDYAAAAAYLAERYKGRIRAWEVWNEPDWFWNAEGGPDARRYTELLKAAYSAIKKVDPSITVLGGSLGGNLALNNYAYLRQMYAAGARGNFDALSIHPYCWPNPPDHQTDNNAWSFAAVPKVEQLLNTELGESNKPIWITEMGWPSSGPADHPISDAVRAGYFRQAVQMVRTWPYVKVFIAYWLDPALDAGAQPPDGFQLWSAGRPSQTWDAYADEVKKRP